MKHIEEFVDDRQKGWCIHCGQLLASTDSNVDHVPSKCFLRKPYPPQLATVRICKICNEGFSRDEAYAAAFLGTVVCGSTEPERQVHASAKAILLKSPKLRERIEQTRTEYKTTRGETRLSWSPELARLERVALKNARGHAFFEVGEPLLDDPDTVAIVPLLAMSPSERHSFEALQQTSVWPEVGSRMMTRVLTGDDLVGGWVMVQEGNYRYCVDHEDGITVRSVILEYLATEVRWG